MVYFPPDLSINMSVSPVVKQVRILSFSVPINEKYVLYCFGCCLKVHLNVIQLLDS